MTSLCANPDHHEPSCECGLSRDPVKAAAMKAAEECFYTSLDEAVLSNAPLAECEALHIAKFTSIIERHCRELLVGQGAEQPDQASRMEKISKVIVDLQRIHARWGDTCVYVRRGGLSWGAVALNYQLDDEEHGVFDLQATHDREMRERLEQIQRLVEQTQTERATAAVQIADLKTENARLREALVAVQKNLPLALKLLPMLDDLIRAALSPKPITGKEPG